MPLLVLIVIGALFYSLFEIFAGLAGGKINDWLAAVLYNGIGTVVPIVVYLASSNKGKSSPKGMLYAGLAGVAIMLFSIVFARIFNRGGNLSYVVPVIYGSAIVLSSAFGWAILKEKVLPLQLLGLILVVLGVICVSLAKARV